MSKKKYTKKQMKAFAKHTFEELVPELWLRDYIMSDDISSSMVLLSEDEQYILHELACDELNESGYPDEHPRTRLMMDIVERLPCRPVPKQLEYFLNSFGDIVNDIPGGKYLRLNKLTEIGEIVDFIKEIAKPGTNIEIGISTKA